MHARKAATCASGGGERRFRVVATFLGGLRVSAAAAPPPHPNLFVCSPSIVSLLSFIPTPERRFQNNLLADKQLTNAGASTANKATPAAADIEDMAGGGGGGGAAGRKILGARARVTKRIGNTAGGLNADGSPGKENTAGDGNFRGTGGAVEGGEEGGEEVEELVPIRREDDFQGWLAQQKAGWKRHREQRKVTRRAEARSQVRQPVPVRPS